MKKTLFTILIILLSQAATSQVTTQMLGVWGVVSDVNGIPVGPGTPVNLKVKSYNQSTGELIYNESRTTTTGDVGPSDTYSFSGSNAPWGVEGEINVLEVTALLGYQVGVNMSLLGPLDFPHTETINLGIHTSYCSNLSIDVGNDSSEPWEWDNSGPYFNDEQMAELNPDKINTILRHNCGCRGCIRNLTTNERIIPLTISSDSLGKITIENIQVEYNHLKVVEKAEYNDTFPTSDGARWTIAYFNRPASSTDHLVVDLPMNYPGSDTQSYTVSGCDRNLRIDEDAVDDAVWRLLNKIDIKDRGDLGTNQKNCRIDKIQLPGGGFRFFDPHEMYFKVHKHPITPQLWGPALVKLTVWI